MNTISLIIALAILAIFFSVESSLRFGEEAKSMKTTEKDKKSTFWLGTMFGINVFILLSSFLLNHYRLFPLFHNQILTFSGTLIMLTGLFIRIMATRTLREYYTRTLKIQENQKVINTGLYRYIRHPGYLGVILIWTGAGISSDNYVGLISVLLITFSVYHYRMNSEEIMLTEAFGDDYRNYKKTTRRIIPFIY